MTAELTNEQIVTNLLVSNEFLKPVKKSAKIHERRNLGNYLASEIKQAYPYEKFSRYSFIDQTKGWNF